MGFTQKEIESIYELRAKCYDVAHILERKLKTDECKNCIDRKECRLVQTNRTNECKKRTYDEAGYGNVNI